MEDGKCGRFAVIIQIWCKIYHNHFWGWDTGFDHVCDYVEK